ncbi:MAG: Fur family transcriptional regulator [Lachnospiraceae bacterium]
MQKQYRTRCRDSIMEYLKSHADNSFSAADIYEDLIRKEESINLATVYRNLEKLTESGQLMKYKMAGEECCRYQFVEPCGNCQAHIHMQCRECGRLFHLECTFMDELTAHLMQHHGFTLECPGSMLSGLCRECREKSNTFSPDESKE